MLKKARCWNCGRKVTPIKNYKHRNLCRNCTQLHIKQNERTNKWKKQRGIKTK